MAKRIAQSNILLLPADQRTNPAAFKIKSDGYLPRVLANPPEPLKVTWAGYKQSVPISGMVTTVQKQYEALMIPYPVDTQTAQVDAQWAEVKKALEAFVAASNANISKYQKEINETKFLLPYDQMAMEDYKNVYPELV